MEIALLVYRNYDSDASEILQATPFESELKILSKFLNSVKVNGGWGK